MEILRGDEKFENPEVFMDTPKMTPDEEAGLVIKKARELGYLS
ncbi:hypothetical protein [Thermococcus chitonophagus]|uniref:Uncharacterized protein n=1 Tax=Thermococcus chitonophagus TaxID=54262 RepID=A0A161K9A1_9EURY|nr:hypothetical protein CHITON_0539 [Thermococcus chitonophagus]